MEDALIRRTFSKQEP